MRSRLILLLATLGLLLVVGAAPRAAEHHIRVPLVASDNSGVTGFVELTQLPHGSHLVVVARGLTPGTTYASFYYESNNCTEPADLLGTFVGGDDGTGQVQGKIDDDLDEVGSVSVRLGPGYGTLLSCATVH